MLVRKTHTGLTFFILMVFIGFAFPLESWAVHAAPVIHTLTQSDGSTFKARQWGDEWLHGWETEEGYTIVFDENLKSWTYATHDFDGNLIRSSRIVGKDYPPIDISRHIRPTGQARKIIHSIKMDKVRKLYHEGVSPTGTANIPVIFVNFIDTNPTYSPLNFDPLLFGAGNYSMQDYYEEVSYGKFSISSGPNGVVGWYKASHTHDYYGENDNEGNDKRPGYLVREAAEAADAAGFNWSPYDQDEDCYVDVVAIVHQGTDEADSGNPTDIWSHQWDLNSAYKYGFSDGGELITTSPCSKGGYVKVNHYIILPETEAESGGITTIGVFAHEYGHALGLPDLYDTDNSSMGVGDWSLMAGGSWGKVSKPGDRPSHLDAWSKYKLGWVTPTQVTRTLIDQPITQVETTPDIYQLLAGGPSIGGEYFLIENRQKVGFDEGLPGAGLLIWHIDENKNDNNYECYPGGPPCVTNHYHVALVQADNLWDLEKNTNSGDTGDPYPGSTGNTSFTGNSTPNSDLYNGNPSGVSVTNISVSGPTMTATLTSPIETMTVNINPTGAGSVTKSPDKATYVYGDTVQLTATANSGYTFSNWSGDVTGSTNPVTVTMNGNKNVTANFAQNQYTLTVKISPSGSGSVTRNPDKLTYVYGDVVTLTATANPGYSFSRCLGDFYSTANPITITMKNDMTVTAYFQVVGYDLTGYWTKPVTQTCRTTSKGRKCTINCTLTIRNDGNTDVLSSFLVAFYLSYHKNDVQLGEHLKDSSVGAIKAKDSKAIKFTYNLPLGRTAKGEYIKALIDAGGDVPEVNKANNIVVFGPIQ